LQKRLLSSKGTKIWHYCNIFPTALIGKNCTIGSYVEIGDNVEIGENCKIEAQVFIPKGVKIGNDVFIGPAVKFTNDLYPKAKGLWKIYPTTVKDGASIGAGSVVRCGVVLGENCGVGAGSVVLKDIPANEVWAGNPAKKIISSWKEFTPGFGGAGDFVG
jgi:UDP-2-acetamido-3-amino-2,3-dideoxy-glucuronate N-acetyltransferase